MQTPWVSPQSRTLRRPYNNLSKLAISPCPWQACHNYWLLMLFYSLTFSMEHSPKFSPQKIKKLSFFLPFFWCVCVYCMILSMSSSRTGKTSRWEQKSEQQLHLAQPCLPLCDPVDCSPPGSSVHGISQERMLEGVAIPSPGHLPNPGIKPASPALAGGLFTSSATWEPWLHRGKGQRKNAGKISRETVMLGVQCTDGLS